MDKVGIGFIGCGNISEAYLKAAAKFPILDIRGVADLKPEAAQARASQFGLEAHSVDALLRDPAVEIIVNLTIPAAHVEVGLMAIAAGISDATTGMACAPRAKEKSPRAVRPSELCRAGLSASGLE